MSKLQKITANGTAYLGIVKGGTLIDPMEIGSLPMDKAFDMYLKMKNAGTLTPVIEFSGGGMVAHVSPLSKSEKILLKISKLCMKHAKATAASLTENQVFDELRGK